VKNIIVLDRSISFGSEAPLCSEIKIALGREAFSIVYGLGGRNIYESDVKDLFMRSLNKKLKDKEFLGVRE
jgi:pyruvate ferredoxin oxidoreductase alpha subunit